MADLTKEQLRQQNETLFANNNSGNISAEDLRTFNNEVIDTLATENNPSFTGSVEVQGDVSASTYYGDGSNLSGVTSEVPQGTVSGSSQIDYPFISNIPSGIVSSSTQISDITGSSLTTASFASQTLTFTKGDGSIFGVNIPDVSGSDISALNQFTQSQEELNTTFATTGSNTFNGNQTINGSSTQNITAPAINNESAILNMSGASIGGRPYNRTFFGVADYSPSGLNFEDYFGIEYYDGFGYNFGSELNVNGKQILLSTAASGSGQKSSIVTVDNYDGTSQVTLTSPNKIAMNGFVEVAGTMNVSGVTNFGTSGSNDKMNVFGGIVLSQGAGIQTDGAFGPAVPFDAPVIFFGGVNFNGSNLDLAGNDILDVGNQTINGTNTIPGSTLDVRDGTGTPRLQVNNATLGGITGIDVLVNGNQFVAGNIAATGSLGIADNNFIISSGSNTVEFSSKFSDGQAGVQFTAPNSKFQATGNFNITCAGITGFDAPGGINFYNNTTIDANGVVNGTNTIPGSTFTVKDGNSTPRLQVQNATLAGLTGADIILNGDILNDGDYTLTGNQTINGTNTAPGNTFIAKDGNGTNRVEVNNATLAGLTSVDVNINGKTQITDTLTTIVDVKVGTQLVLLDYANLDFANDTAAAAGGVPLGGLYHHNGHILIRTT